MHELIDIDDFIESSISLYKRTYIVYHNLETFNFDILSFVFRFKKESKKRNLKAFCSFVMNHDERFICVNDFELFMLFKRLDMPHSDINEIKPIAI